MSQALSTTLRSHSFDRVSSETVSKRAKQATPIARGQKTSREPVSKKNPLQIIGEVFEKFVSGYYCKQFHG